MEVKDRDYAKLFRQSRQYKTRLNRIRVENFELKLKIKKYKSALNTACFVIAKAMCPNGDWEQLKHDFAEAYLSQAEREVEE